MIRSCIKDIRVRGSRAPTHRKVHTVDGVPRTQRQYQHTSPPSSRHYVPQFPVSHFYPKPAASHLRRTITITAVSQPCDVTRYLTNPSRLPVDNFGAITAGGNPRFGHSLLLGRTVPWRQHPVGFHVHHERSSPATHYQRTAVQRCGGMPGVTRFVSKRKLLCEPPDVPFRSSVEVMPHERVESLSFELLGYSLLVFRSALALRTHTRWKFFTCSTSVPSESSRYLLRSSPFKLSPPICRKNLFSIFSNSRGEACVQDTGRSSRTPAGKFTSVPPWGVRRVFKSLQRGAQQVS